MRDNPAYRQFEVGHFTYGCPLVMFTKEARLSVGSFCSIGDGARILLGGNHRMDWVSTYPFPAKKGFESMAERVDYSVSKGGVVIGSDVWIGQDVIILSGVTIGHGAVIGAGSVVTKCIPPYAIAAGNPAKVVRMRFSEIQITRLLAIKWWEWPLERIKANIPNLLNDDIEAFLAAVSDGDTEFEGHQ